LFRFILDTANADYPILHTKHQRSIPIFQDLVHDSQFDHPDLHEQGQVQEDMVACVLRAAPRAGEEANEAVSNWLKQLVQLRTSQHVQGSSSLQDSIALL
jgi:hypothetical protein